MAIPCFCIQTTYTSYNARKIHSTISLVALIILVWVASTGVLYRVLRNVFHFEKQNVHILMALHTFNGKEIVEWFLGDSSAATTSIWMNVMNGSSYVPILFGILIVFMIFTGVNMTLTRFCNSRSQSMTMSVPLPTPWNSRTLHRWINLLAVLPLSSTVMTGAIWTIFKYWLGFPKEQLSILLQIHQGSIIMDPVIYTTTLAILVIAAVSAAIPLLPIVRKYTSRVNLTTSMPLSNQKKTSALERTRYTLINAQQESSDESDDENDDSV